MKLSTVILAAGKGKRMKSDLPKVLHPLHGRAMIHYVIDLAEKIHSERIVVVVGHKKELVIREVQGRGVDFVEQKEQLGTGHAVLQTRPLFENYQGAILVLNGDVPLLSVSTIENLIQIHRQEKPVVSMLTAIMDDPTGYGRIIRDENGYVIQNVEEKDASPEIKKIKEVNVGIYLFDARRLFETLPLVKNDNSQGEYYLPDVIKIFVENGEKVVAVTAANPEETYGINTVEHLKQAEEIYSRRLAAS